ncbi:MAG: hypothetical protein MJ060_04975, partial [Clostridia bacterium]|nr:hypothetical protein [Clostridia bacterium]
SGVATGVANSSSELCQTMLSALGQMSEHLHDNPESDALMLVPWSCTNCCSKSTGQLFSKENANAILTIEDMVYNKLIDTFKLAETIICGDVITQVACYLKGAGAGSSFKELAQDLLNCIWQAYLGDGEGGLLDAALKIASETIVCNPVREKRAAIAVVGNANLTLSPILNNDIFDKIAVEGCNVVPPSLGTLAIHSALVYAQKLEDSKDGVISQYVDYLKNYQNRAAEEIKSAGLEYASCLSYDVIQKCAQSQGVDMNVLAGSGWTTQATMFSLVKSGYYNILYAQTFACLSNHVGGSATFKDIRAFDSRANIASIEYDAGISQVNQINRIKLLAALAKSK